MPRSIFNYHRETAREFVRTASRTDSSPEAVKARNNFSWFLEYVLDLPPPPHIQEWIPILVTGQSNNILHLIAGQDTSILAPRGSAKSTILQALTAWAIGVHSSPDILLPIQILYISYTIDVARSKSTVIKRIIESPKYQEVFPWILKNPKRWADEHWEIDKQWAGINSMTADFTLSCAGLTGAIASKRSHLIVIDDSIKSAEDIENPEVRSKMESNWNNVISKTRFEGARALDLGTRFRADDIHTTAFIPEKGWKVIEQSALNFECNFETGLDVEKSYWPEMYSTEFLQAEREADPISFSFQRQNKIVRVKEISIDPTWISEGTPPVHFEKLVLGIDLASSTKESADYSAFVLGGYENKRIHILDAVRGRWAGNIEKLDVLLEILADWGIIHDSGNLNEKEKPIYYSGDVVLEIYIESVAYQASLAADFESYVLGEQKLYNLVCVPVSGRGEKRQRLLGITGILQNGLVSFNSYKNLKRLKDELINFGSFDHDDLADAFVYCLRGLTRYRPLESETLG